MASISRNEYVRMQKERQNQSSFQTQSTRVSYFSLKDDGDEAIVRFVYSNPDQLEIFTTHSVTIDGKFRRVNCLREPGTPVHTCPLCESGQNPQNRTYIKLIEYTRGEDGTVTYSPKIWERSASYVNILTGLFEEYGDLSNCVFKIKRSGERGSMQTTYSIMFGNPTIYNEQVYPKDFSAFENYKILGGPLLEKNYNELKEILGDAAEVEETVIGTSTVQSDPLPFGNNQQTRTTETQNNWQYNQPYTTGQQRIKY